MALRWTVTDKWRDKWFRNLKAKHKLLWLYLCDSCDIAGVIEWDLDLWAKEIGSKISEEEFWSEFTNRVIPIPETDKMWLPKFIEIQQRCSIDDLNEENNAHKPILKAVVRYNLKDLLRGLEGASQPPCKRNSKGNSNSKGKDYEIEKKKFAEFVTLTDDEYAKLLSRLGDERRVRAAIEILDNYKGANGRKYASDYRAILNWVLDKLREKEVSGRAPKKVNMWKCSACGKDMPENERYNHWNEGVCPKFSAASSEFVRKIRDEITQGILNAKD